MLLLAAHRRRNLTQYSILKTNLTMSSSVMINSGVLLRVGKLGLLVNQIKYN